MHLAPACLLRKKPGPRSESIPVVKHTNFVFLKPFGTYVVRFFKIVFLARSGVKMKDFSGSVINLPFLSFHISILMTVYWVCMTRFW